MIIHNVRIEGGFLNGFDLSLSSGLNVLIGARGTGKTSVVELLRYALGADSHTEEAAIRSEDHALAVLDDGVVAVSLTDGFEEIHVSRAAGEHEPSSSGPFVPPIILSQTEIETLGLSEAGRIALLDGFVPEISALRGKEAVACNSIVSISREIASLEKEISNLSDSLMGRAVLMDELDALRQQQVELGSHSRLADGLQSKVDALTAAESNVSSVENAATHFSAFVEAQVEALQVYELVDAPAAMLWNGDGVDPLAKLRHQYSDAANLLAETRAAFSTLLANSNELAKESNFRKLEVQRSLRSARLELDGIRAGAGAIAKKVSAIQMALGKIAAIEHLISDRNERRSLRRERRDFHIEELNSTRQTITDLRIAAAEQLNAALKPYISIEIEPQAQRLEYSRSIASGLRGSGLKYNELAQLISSSLSPSELLRYVDDDDFEEVSQLLGIQRDRATKLLGSLRDAGMGSIVTARVEDDVKMRLLDGIDYKEVTELSAGQRCTVVLSVVLQHRDRTLIIDQPEDHLDNAFIANTVIKSLQTRRRAGQMLISTHNANIPVLGGADLVVELTSDGRNGYVESCQPLKHEKSVNAISTVMEGGRLAFLHRADFYSDNLKK